MSTFERFSRNGEQGRLGADSGYYPKWRIYYSTFENYMDDFSMLGQSAMTRIENHFSRLKMRDKKPVIIDLMADTYAIGSLASSIFQGKEIRGLAVGLRDKSSKHGHVSYNAEDLGKKITWKRIHRWLNHDTADIIMARPYGGYNHLPTNPRFYNYAMGRIWQFLNPDRGMAILQIPPIEELGYAGIPIQEWIKTLDEHGIIHEYTPMYPGHVLDGHEPFGLLMIQRQKHDPDRLPVPASFDIRSKGKRRGIVRTIKGVLKWYVTHL